ncbi:hypothetical protein [Azorhizobium doebereinerae]|uniref:hypothetical protein n=1 Tax=Azorhizobium doebereinerae TaxID=281091 RepID=UPI0012EBC591|nr:hypothetical protein [Azorhizobium doebereinerae]
MISNVSASYNVLSLFTEKTGDTSPATAVDAIIEKVRQMRADASPSYTRGASLGAVAWLAQTEAESTDTQLTAADLATDEVKSRFTSEAAYNNFIYAFEHDESGNWVNSDSLDYMIDYMQWSYDYDQGKQTFIDKANAAGSDKILELISRGTDITTMSSNIAVYNSAFTLSQSGKIFIEEQTEKLKSTTDASEIARITDGIEMATSYIESKKDLVANFQIYMDYVQWDWSAREVYDVAGKFAEKTADGTYEIGVFQISLKSTGRVFWNHDGSGTAQVSNAGGTEYRDEDLHYMKKFYETQTSTSMSDLVQRVQTNHPYRMVVDGRVVHTNKPPSVTSEG